MREEQKKKPSYLEEVEGQLPELILADGCGGCQAADELSKKLWLFVRRKIVESYWNGVSNGASGKAKPKPQKSNLNHNEKSYVSNTAKPSRPVRAQA